MKLSYDYHWERDFGLLTPAIHRVVSTWLDIDWFVPPTSGAEERARALLQRHNLQARQHQPTLFPESLSIRSAPGCWDELSALCARVRAQQGWDWKYSVLKQLCGEHSRRYFWDLHMARPYAQDLLLGRAERQDLFILLHNSLIWNFSPKLDYEVAALSCAVHSTHHVTTNAEDAGWYMSYANMDVTHCIEWLLAEHSADLDEDPFWPLLQCYAEGFLPFSVARDEMILFSFEV